MKNFLGMAILLISFSNAASAGSPECLQIMKVSTAVKGAKTINIDAVASKQIFEAASKARLGMVPVLWADDGIEAFESASMACCRLIAWDQERQVVQGSERCVIGVSVDGSLAEVQASFNK